MTLADLDRTARDAAKQAWYAARNAYYAAERQAGNISRSIRTELPKSLRSLQAFFAESQKGMKYLSDNSKQAAENIRKLKD